MENSKDELWFVTTEHTTARVRPQLYWWVKRMENRLSLKDKSHKYGWLDGKLRYYIIRIFECWKEAVEPLHHQTTGLILRQSKQKAIKEPSEITQKDVESAIKKCVDGANFFMMLADNLRNILLERGIKVNDKDRR